MLHPGPLAIARFTHPARFLVYSFSPQPPPLISVPLSLSLSFSLGTLSLGVAAALSNSRCNIQRLLAVVCGGGSAIATKKRAPRGRSLRPSNWRRCPSTIARMIVLSFAPLMSVLCPPRVLSLFFSRVLSPSLFLELFSFSLRSFVFFILSFFPSFFPFP